MKKFTKFLIVLLALVLVASVLCGCKKDPEPTLPEKISCYAPDGAPAMALANIIADKKVGEVEVATTITTGTDVIAKCTSGEADMAILPTNAAVTVLSKRDEYQIFTVNTYGLLYLVGTTQISSLNELVGKTVYSIGANNTPQLVFNKVLDTKNIAHTELGETVESDKINLKYEEDGSTIIPLLLNGNAEFAVLGEPAVTQAKAKLASKEKTLYELADLQELWKDAVGNTKAGYPQASMIVKKSLLQNSSFAEALHNKLSENTAYAKQNAADLSDLLESAGSSLSVTYTAEIIDRCNLVCLWASDEKSNIEMYLGQFKALSALLPLDDDIFYAHKN